MFDDTAFEHRGGSDDDTHILYMTGIRTRHVSYVRSFGTSRGCSAAGNCTELLCTRTRTYVCTRTPLVVFFACRCQEFIEQTADRPEFEAWKSPYCQSTTASWSTVRSSINEHLRTRWCLPWRCCVHKQVMVRWKVSRSSTAMATDGALLLLITRHH